MQQAFDHRGLQALVAGVKAGIGEHQEIVSQRRWLPVVERQPPVVWRTQESIVAGIQKLDRCVLRKRDAYILDCDQTMIVPPEEADGCAQTGSEVLLQSEADFIAEWPQQP